MFNYWCSELLTLLATLSTYNLIVDNDLSMSEAGKILIDIWLSMTSISSRLYDFVSY